MKSSFVKKLEKSERKTWNTMMNGSEADARTVKNEEGVNYIAWCAAADALRIERQRIEAEEAIDDFNYVGSHHHY